MLSRITILLAAFVANIVRPDIISTTPTSLSLEY